METKTVKDPMQKAAEAMAAAMLSFLKESQQIQVPKIHKEQVEDLPLILQVRHVSKIMGLSKSATYEVFKLKDFPAIVGVNERKCVYRDSFFSWLLSKESKA